jgi:hypothetical protein
MEFRTIELQLVLLHYGNERLWLTAALSSGLLFHNNLLCMFFYSVLNIPILRRRFKINLCKVFDGKTHLYRHLLLPKIIFSPTYHHRQSVRRRHHLNSGSKLKYGAYTLLRYLSQFLHNALLHIGLYIKLSM